MVACVTKDLDRKMGISCVNKDVGSAAGAKNEEFLCN